MNFQLQHQPRNISGNRLSYPTGVTEQDVLLQLRELPRLNALIRQDAKTGVDAVMRLAVLQRPQHHLARTVQGRMPPAQSRHAGCDVSIKMGNPQGWGL
jgi:hypothetical protein